MSRLTSLLPRALFLVAFIIVLPVIALPSVARFLDRTLYGEPGPTIPPMADAQMGLQVVQPQAAERTSPARFDSTPLAANPGGQNRSPLEGLDALSAAPPPLAPLGNFPLAASLQSADESTAPPVDSRQAMITEVQKIRDRLEVLGAKYIVLETADGSGKFRFYCQMLLNESSPYTRDFEASSTDPTFAAQAVLQEVESWRSAARPAATRFE